MWTLFGVAVLVLVGVIIGSRVQEVNLRRRERRLALGRRRFAAVVRAFGEVAAVSAGGDLYNRFMEEVYESPEEPSPWTR